MVLVTGNKTEELHLAVTCGDSGGGIGLRRHQDGTSLLVIKTRESLLCGM